MADFQNPCLGWDGGYPYAMVIAAYSALGTFALGAQLDINKNEFLQTCGIAQTASQSFCVLQTRGHLQSACVEVAKPIIYSFL